MRLEDLQTDFINAIFGGNPDIASKYVIGDDKLNAKQRFGIYKGSVHGILTQSLETTFPVCKSLVGDEFFTHMCDVYIDKYPPTTPYFVEFGETLSKFLADFEPTNSIPYLADISMLEWARHKIWHKQLSQIADFSTLAEFTDEQQSRLVFELSDTLCLLSSDYRIDHIWFAHQEDSGIKLEDIDLHQSVKILMWKAVDGIKISLLNEAEEDRKYWDFLHDISVSKNIMQLAEKYGENMPEFLNKCIQEGRIQTFKTV